MIYKNCKTSLSPTEPFRLWVIKLCCHTLSFLPTNYLVTEACSVLCGYHGQQDKWRTGSLGSRKSWSIKKQQSNIQSRKLQHYGHTQHQAKLLSRDFIRNEVEQKNS